MLFRSTGINLQNTYNQHNANVNDYTAPDGLQTTLDKWFSNKNYAIHSPPTTRCRCVDNYGHSIDFMYNTAITDAWEQTSISERLLCLNDESALTFLEDPVQYNTLHLNREQTGTGLQPVFLHSIQQLLTLVDLVMTWLC